MKNPKNKLPSLHSLAKIKNFPQNIIKGGVPASINSKMIIKFLNNEKELGNCKLVIEINSLVSDKNSTEKKRYVTRI